MDEERARGGGRWQLHVDTGGTFTDGLARDPDGRWRRLKVLSSSALRSTVRAVRDARSVAIDRRWPAGEGLVRGARFSVPGQPSTAQRTVIDTGDDGAVLVLDDAAQEPLPPGTPFELAFDEPPSTLAARLLTATAAGDRLPPADLRLGTTLATNALLTRSGEPVVLFVTRGLRDLLTIGTQQRPDLFALEIVRPPPLHAGVVEVQERLEADGRVLTPLDLDRLAADAREWLDRGVRCAAVALLHADRHPDHERRAEACLLELGFTHVSRSSLMAAEIKILPRAQTAVVDASVTPVVRRHLVDVGEAVGGDGRVSVMTSAGGLVAASEARGKDLLLSGPAAGVVGAVHAGRTAGADSVIGFDMGGTSTDVARYDGAYEYVFTSRVGPAEILAPALAINTVAAGGGSVCGVDANGLYVGPDSAGARPGPACYGAGGPLTLTDVNLLLGRLDPDRFGLPIDRQAAERAAAALLESLARHHGERPELATLLEGLRSIADQRMSAAIREISVRRGYDPRSYTLVAFGGAGGQHACAVADELGVESILVPADAGLLSARGLSAAVVERFAVRQVLAPLADVRDAVGGWMEELGDTARREAVRSGAAPTRVAVRRRLAALRFEGQEAFVEIDVPPDGELARAFLSRYLAIFGDRPVDRPIELVSLKVVAAERAGEPQPATFSRAASVPVPRGHLRARFRDGVRETPIHERTGLPDGALVDGPALVVDPYSTTVVEPGWSATCGSDGTLRLVRDRGGGSPDAGRMGDSAASREVTLELFTNRFETIAREMGLALERSAVSTNVKERLDFSCAVLDRDGRLVANAPHVPVHLGSLGLCVRRVAQHMPLEAGDVVVTNHPAFGGSHLPDVTVVMPVFADADAEATGSAPSRIGYVAARAHHAEIGGTRPGSMPPSASRLSEEGVVLAPFRLFRAGEPCWARLRRRLCSTPHPSRAVEDNVADVRAAVAACRRGVAALEVLARREGADTVRRYMGLLEARAAERMKNALARLGDGNLPCRDELDDGTPLAVNVAIRAGKARIDFEGTGGVHAGNLNATPAIVRSAVLYVMRLLVAEPLPLNEGLLDAVSIDIPRGLLDPEFPDDPDRAPAVGGGNVETSQRLVNLLVEALGLAAPSQGTMNNVLFGDERTSYYETVCGGCGAGPGFHGASAVHSHMTNTRITDPEILETRFPVRLVRFGVREGSGGGGRYRGGDGVVRELAFLAPLELSVLTQNRTRGPRGVAGGEPGRPGAQRIVRARGGVERLAPIDEARVGPGDRLVLETPGGGGHGPSDDRDGS